MNGRKVSKIAVLLLIIDAELVEIDILISGGWSLISIPMGYVWKTEWDKSTPDDIYFYDFHLSAYVEIAEIRAGIFFIYSDFEQSLQVTMSKEIKGTRLDSYNPNIGWNLIGSPIQRKFPGWGIERCALNSKGESVEATEMFPNVGYWVFYVPAAAPTKNSRSHQLPILPRIQLTNKLPANWGQIKKNGI